MIYVTNKYVVLRDWKLGLAYYSVLILTLIYMFSRLVVSKAYLQFDHSPSGHVRIITNSPPLKESEDHLKLDQMYCCGKNSSFSSCRECRALDGLALNWPAESKAINIATFIMERWEETGHEDDKTEFSKLREDRYFTLNPEHVLLKIEHSIAALPDTDDAFAASRKMMTGRIIGKDGKIIRKLNSVGKPDGIRLIELLRAADVQNLDVRSDASNARNRTFRENGIVLRVTITYENADKTIFGTSDPVYTYSVRRMKFSEYKVKQEIPVVDPTSFSHLHEPDQIKRRKVLKRFCTRLEFIQAGKIGKFSLPNLVIELISGLGLLGYAAAIIEFYVLYVSPARNSYCQSILEDSQDRNGGDKSIDRQEPLNDEKIVIHGKSNDFESKKDL